MMLRFAVFSLYILVTQLFVGDGVLGSTETDVAHTTDPVLQRRRKLEFKSLIRRQEAYKKYNKDNATELVDLQAHQRRALQAQFESVCNGNGVPDANGNVTALLAPEYMPTCTCTESNNLDSLNLDPSTITDPTQIVTLLNDLISKLFINIDWSCANDLATCFPSGNCALLDASYLLDFKGVAADFTLEELLALAGAGGSSVDITQFLTGQQTGTLCSEFTSGQTGVACLEDVTTVAQLQATGDRPCTLSYNNVNCGSCTITSAACVVAECSAHGIASVNTCTNTGVNTIFQVLPYYTGASMPTALTVGGAGPAPAPVATGTAPVAPAPAPVATGTAPVATGTAPVATGTVPVATGTAPVAGPVTVPGIAPVVRPAPVAIPMPPPVTVSVPRPVSIPLPPPVPVSVSRPVPAIIPVPVPVTVTTPTPGGGVDDECASKSAKSAKGSKGKGTKSAKCKKSKAAKAAKAGESKAVRRHRRHRMLQS
jgi:hypothetical protein